MESLDTHLVLEHWLVSEDTPQPHNQSWPKTQFLKKKQKNTAFYRKALIYIKRDPDLEITR